MSSSARRSIGSPSHRQHGDKPRPARLTEYGVDFHITAPPNAVDTTKLA
jgi:hypothetical protein